MKKLAFLLTPLLVLSLILGAIGCSDEEATPTSAPTPTPVSTPTPTPEPITLKVSTAFAETTPKGPALKLFKELLEQYTNGRVTVELFMGGVLFSASAEWEALITGAVDMSLTSPYYAATAIPQAYMFYNKSGIWQGQDHGWDVIHDAEFMKVMGDLFAEKDIKLLGINPGNTVEGMFSREKEITSFADMEGMLYGFIKGGTPQPLISGYAKAISVPVAFAEATLALQQGTIDLMYNSLSTGLSLKHEEPAQYVFLWQGGYNVNLFWMGMDVWNGLPTDIQDIIVDRVIPEVQVLSRQLIKEADVIELQTLTDNVKAVHWATPEDLAASREFLKTDVTTQEELNRYGAELLDLIAKHAP